MHNTKREPTADTLAHRAHGLSVALKDIVEAQYCAAKDDALRALADTLEEITDRLSMMVDAQAKPSLTLVHENPTA